MSRGGTTIVLSLLAVAVVPPAARAQFAGFQWELKGSPSGSGTVASDHLHVVGPDEPSACAADGATTWFETIAPMAGHVSVVVQYITLDDWPSYKYFDAPAWVVDGEVYIPPSSVGWSDGTYTIELDVLPQQAFGLGVWAADCCCGPGISDVVELVFTPATWTSLGAPIDPHTGPVVEGKRIDAAGDINGDGHDDIVVGIKGDGGPPGLVRVCSGIDGAVLIEESGHKSLGTAVAGADDLDGDGVPDFAGGAPAFGPFGVGAMFAWSGATGAEIFEWHGVGSQTSVGKSLAGLGDTDGDGFDDVGVSSLSTGGLGRVTVLGGPDGHEIRHFTSGVANDGFGSSIAGIGDADLDGLPDVLVGAPASLGGAALNGRVYLYSGGTGALLLSIEGDEQQFGADVAAAGDLDQDARADLLVADPQFMADGVTIGRAAAFAGLDGALLVQTTGAPGSTLLNTVDGGADLTGDGTPDMVTAVAHPSTALRVYSGADGTLADEFSQPFATFVLGGQAAVVGNIDGQGMLDVGLATSAGAFLFKALDDLGPPHLTGTGDVAPDQPVTLLVDHGKPGAATFLVLGASGLNQPLLGGVLVPSPDVLVPFAIDAAGGAELEGRWPSGLPAGTSVWFQVWIQDPAGPAGWTSTNGLIAGQSSG